MASVTPRRRLLNWSKMLAEK